jgi:hypothetical protein
MGNWLQALFLRTTSHIQAISRLPMEPPPGGMWIAGVVRTPFSTAFCLDLDGFGPGPGGLRMQPVKEPIANTAAIVLN